MKKYEYLVNELANVKSSTEYIKVLKWFDAEVYKNNKEERVRINGLFILCLTLSLASLSQAAPPIPYSALPSRYTL